MPLKMDINQISQWVHLKLNQRSKCEKNNSNIRKAVLLVRKQLTVTRETLWSDEV